MKKIVLFFMLAMASLLIAQTVSVDSPMGSFKMTIEEAGSSSSDGAVSVVDAIAERIELLEKNFHSKLNRLDQRRAENITNEIFDLLALLPTDMYATLQAPSQASQEKIDSSVSISMNVSPPAEQVMMEQKPVETKPVHTAMSEREFQQLYDNVEDESFSDDQLAVVRVATRSKYFSVNQLTRLLDVFSFSDDKVECVQMVYPRIVDTENSHNLLRAFTFSDDKKKVERIISQ